MMEGKLREMGMGSGQLFVIAPRWELKEAIMWGMAGERDVG